MILLLEYLAGLFSTFVISAAMFSVILTVTSQQSTRSSLPVTYGATEQT